MVGWLQELTARWHPHLHHLSQHQPFLHVYSTILSIRSAAPGRLNSIFCGMVPKRWIAGKHALSLRVFVYGLTLSCVGHVSQSKLGIITPLHSATTVH